MDELVEFGASGRGNVHDRGFGLPRGPNSWALGIQATLRPDDGGESIYFGPNNYGPKTLPAGTFNTNIFVNTIGDIDALITPRLYKID